MHVIKIGIIIGTNLFRVAGQSVLIEKGIMINELIFLLYVFCIAVCSLMALYFSSETLIAFICLSAVLANLFVSKSITLFGLTATASDALAVGASLSLNLLQEYYGRSKAQQTVYISFFCLIVYTIVSYLHLTYVPSPVDTQQVHFYAILSFMPRITIASLISYFIVQNIDCRLYAKLSQKYMPNFILKNYLCVGVTQLIDTVLFSFLALYGILENIGQIIIVSYSIKLAVLFIAAPFIHLARTIVLKKE